MVQALAGVEIEFQRKRKPRTRKGAANQCKPFVAWDGEECRDAGYCLFGASTGHYVRNPHLTTKQMLECIIDCGRDNPGAFHVGFAFYYDVNHILKGIGKLRLAILHKTGRVRWEGYDIEHIPHKIFIVSQYDNTLKKRVRVRIDDCFTYFRSRFDKALIKYRIGTAEQQQRITEGKDHRADFWWREIDDIERYWREELVLLVELMGLIRENMNDAGYFIGQWHGPGALASYALKQHGMAEFKRETPEDIRDAVRSAYSAGWFERFKIGHHVGPVYTADINSAYVYAISLLPNLADGTWFHVEHPEAVSVRETRFALYHIRMSGGFAQFMASSHGIPMPLPLREISGRISHPVQVDGWYWAPEAALVAGMPNVEIVEAWVFKDDGTYPFKWVARDYAHRLDLQKLGDPAEKIIKWTLASLYGRLAQRVGWDEKNCEPPAWHQLEWAGFITSMCRSMCYRAAMAVATLGGLVSIDTDGVMSTVPFPDGCLQNGIGDALGQWKVEEFSELIYIQNGIYWVRNIDGSWEDPKLRGVDKDALRRGDIKMDADTALEYLASGKNIEVKKKTFIGYGQALHTRWERHCQWEEVPHSIDPEHSGKRQHSTLTCRTCKRGISLTEGLHDLAPLPPDTIVSQPHKLPWLDPKRVDIKELIRTYGADTEECY